MNNNMIKSGLLMACAVILGACGSDNEDQIKLNQPGGVTLSAPGFLQSRAVVEDNLDARISVVADGVTYIATPTRSGASWSGEVVVPEGSDATLNVLWVETGVPGLPADLNGELPLAVYSEDVLAINENQAFEISAGQYTTSSTVDRPMPQLDIDEDGDSNLEERMAGSSPNDPLDTLPVVTILYTDRAPIIDGRYDSLWNNAQFLDNEREALNIDKIIVDNGIEDPDEDQGFRWAGMHDGTFLYLLIFAEAGNRQDPWGDSVFAYEDDAVDIMWDGNNSKLAGYDGFDDFHAIIPLLSDEAIDNPNLSRTAFSRFALGDRSSPIDESAFEFAVCLCAGDQQIYEIKLDLAAARIPLDGRFGFEIQLNNDFDGGVRDAKWAWFDTSGVDSTWRFPLKMGTAELEPVPF